MKSSPYEVQSGRQADAGGNNSKYSELGLSGSDRPAFDLSAVKCDVWFSIYLSILSFC
jgi:hypothetical protein